MSPSVYFLKRVHVCIFTLRFLHTFPVTLSYSLFVVDGLSTETNMSRRGTRDATDKEKRQQLNNASARRSREKRRRALDDQRACIKTQADTIETQARTIDTQVDTIETQTRTIEAQARTIEIQASELKKLRTSRGDGAEVTECSDVYLDELRDCDDTVGGVLAF